MDLLVEWGRTCGLRFNPEKTVAVVFSRSRREFTELVSVDGVPIPYSDTVRYLGVTLDRKLSWRPHLDDRIKRAKKFLMHVASITQKTWGPLPKLLYWTFTCVIRPMIVYGAMAWGYKVERKFFQDSLRSLNGLALSTMASYPNSSPIRGVEMLTDTCPLHLYILKEGLCTFIRLHASLPLDWSGSCLLYTSPSPRDS